MLIAEALDPITDDDQIDAFTNKLGGKPIWPSNAKFPPKKWAYCRHCKASMIFIIQIYAPLDSSPLNRFFYVFACDSPQCCSRRDSWRVIRAQQFDVDLLRKHRSNLAARQKQALATKTSNLFDPKSWACKVAEGVSDGLDSLNSLLDKLDIEPTKADYNTEICQAEDDTPSLVTTVELSGIMINEKDGQRSLSGVKTWPDPEKFFPGFYLDVFDGACLDKSSSEDYSHEMKLLKQYQQEQGLSSEPTSPASSSNDWSSEAYEKMGLVQSKVFKNFQKIVQQCPTQVLRYEFKGNPLFYAEDKELMSGDLPKCPRCRLQRVFEFQLMPAILTVLPVSCMITTASNDNKEKKIVVGLDFGTVLAYTCSANCDADCMKFETVEECDEILRRLDAGEDITSYNEEFAVAQIE